LRNDKRNNFTTVKTGEQPQRDGDRRVKVRTGNPCGQVNRHGDAQTPDDADFPLTEAGSRDLKRSDAPNAEKDQQPGTEELCDALAF
jgi:hypothetical protein